MERSALHVEGKDDLYAIVNLLMRHGVDYENRRSELPELREIGSCEKVLVGMETAVKTSTGRAIGFVLDADSPIENRWNAVRVRLQRVDVVVPGTPLPVGFVAESAKYKSTVGV